MIIAPVADDQLFILHVYHMLLCYFFRSGIYFNTKKNGSQKNNKKNNNKKQTKRIQVWTIGIKKISRNRHGLWMEGLKKHTWGGVVDFFYFF